MLILAGISRVSDSKSAVNMNVTGEVERKHYTEPLNVNISAGTKALETPRTMRRQMLSSPSSPSTIVRISGGGVSRPPYATDYSS